MYYRYHTIVNPNVLVRDSEVNLRNYPFTVGDAILNRLTIKYSIITQSFTARPTVLNVLQRRSSPGRLDLEWGLLQKSSVHNRSRWIDEGGGGLGGRPRRCCFRRRQHHGCRRPRNQQQPWVLKTFCRESKMGLAATMPYHRPWSKYHRLVCLQRNNCSIFTKGWLDFHWCTRVVKLAVAKPIITS